MWFERPFTFKLGPHLLRGRVDRVDRLPDGGYELIDYKTGRPEDASASSRRTCSSRSTPWARARRGSSSPPRQSYYYVLDDEKVPVEQRRGGDRDWIRETVLEVGEGILAQGFEPTPSFAACSVCDFRIVCPAAER